MQLATLRNLALAATTISVVGCYSPYIRMPNFAHPGTAAQQRADAERFDPYPDPDAGPPIVGGRPLGFTRPLTETEWSRRYVAPPPGVAQPAPVMTFPTSPVVTSPFSSSPPSTLPPTYAPAAPIVAPTYPSALPSPANPTQIQPRSPY